MGLRWALCDADGRELAPLADFLSDRLEVNLNGLRTGTVTVSLEDEVVPLAKPAETRLKCWLDDYITLNAAVHLPHHEGGVENQGGTLSISATDNTKLATASTISWPPLAGYDQSDILALLVAHANYFAQATYIGIDAGSREHGIILGDLPRSVIRDRGYFDGKNIWEALVEMSGVIDGPDFELNPLDRDDGTFMQFNTFYPKQGRDRTDLTFEGGFGADNITWAWDPTAEELTNVVVYAGAPTDFLAAGYTVSRALAYIAFNKESVKKIGPYTQFIVDTSVSEVGTLQSLAQAIVAARAWPIDSFTIAPALSEDGADEARLGVPPRFGPTADPDADYWLGDEISAFIREDGVVKELAGRVQSAVLSTADAVGNVATEVVCVPAERFAAVSGWQPPYGLRVDPADLTAGDQPDPFDPNDVPSSPAPTPAKPPQRPPPRQPFRANTPIGKRPRTGLGQAQAVSRPRRR